MSVSEKLITTHFLLSGTVMTKSHENQILALITQQRWKSLCNHGLFKYSLFFSSGDIIGNFTIFKG